MPPLAARLHPRHPPGAGGDRPGLLGRRHRRFTGTRQYGEAAQVTQLAAVARRYRVKTVMLQVGANDDAALVATGITCIRAFLDVLTPPCRQTVGPLVPQRMAATAAKVEKAVGAVRAVMRDAGYADKTWRLVLVSYAAPVTERMIPLNAAQGCPYSRADAQWGRTVLFPALSDALRGVAARTGTAFLDLLRATEGREACSTRTPRRTGSGGSRSTRARWSTAGSTRSASTSRRSRSTRRLRRTPRSAAAWPRSCDPATRQVPACPAQATASPCARPASSSQHDEVARAVVEPLDAVRR